VRALSNRAGKRDATRGGRKRFSNNQMIKEIPLLLQSGMLKRAVRTDVKVWCKMFALPEPERKRARLIKEPMELNEHWKLAYPNCTLPSIDDIFKITASADFLIQGDLKCYYMRCNRITACRSATKRSH
jgi:hypothetical protein